MVGAPVVARCVPTQSRKRPNRGQRAAKAWGGALLGAVGGDVRVLVISAELGRRVIAGGVARVVAPAGRAQRVVVGRLCLGEAEDAEVQQLRDAAVGRLSRDAADDLVGVDLEDARQLVAAAG